MPKDIFVVGADGTLQRRAYVSPDPAGSRVAKAQFEALRIDSITLAGVGPLEGPANERPILVVKSINPSSGTEKENMGAEQVQAGTEERIGKLEQMVTEIHQSLVAKKSTQPGAAAFTHEITLARAPSGNGAVVTEQRGAFPLDARAALENLVLPVLKSAESVKVSFTPGADRVEMIDPNQKINDLTTVVTDVQKQIGEVMKKLNGAPAPAATAVVPASKQAAGAGDGAPAAPAPAPARAKTQEEMDGEFLDWIIPMNALGEQGQQ